LLRVQVLYLEARGLAIVDGCGTHSLRLARRETTGEHAAVAFAREVDPAESFLAAEGVAAPVVARPGVAGAVAGCCGGLEVEGRHAGEGKDGAGELHRAVVVEVRDGGFVGDLDGVNEEMVLMVKDWCIYIVERTRSCGAARSPDLR